MQFFPGLMEFVELFRMQLKIAKGIYEWKNFEFRALWNRYGIISWWKFHFYIEYLYYSTAIEIPVYTIIEYFRFSIRR